jgi:superfamily II DNA or RNA helicase
MVLTAGFDHPNVGCVIMAAPTKSLTKYIQQIGRGTRLKDENYVTRFKQEVVVLDIVDVTSKHRLINTWTLDKGKTLEEKTFITKQKKLDLIAQRDVKIKLNATKKDTRVNLLKLPKVKISDSIRMQEPASEKQLAWIAKSGYDIVNTNYTKAMCSEIISNLPATESQVWRLAKEGYDVSQGVTIAEAKLAFVALDEKKAKENYQKTLSKNNFPFTDLS